MEMKTQRGLCSWQSFPRLTEIVFCEICCQGPLVNFMFSEPIIFLLGKAFGHKTIVWEKTSKAKPKGLYSSLMSLLVSFKIIRGTFLNTMHLLRIQAPSGMFVNVWQLSLGKKKRPWFPLFPNFHGINTLPMANFKLQHESLNKEGGGWRDINLQCSCEPVSASSNTSSPQTQIEAPLQKVKVWFCLAAGHIFIYLCHFFEFPFV